MLIIRRRRGESIVIGEDIEIEILETSASQVKLGISAPREITVLRSEIRVTRDVNLASSTNPPIRTNSRNWLNKSAKSLLPPKNHPPNIPQ